MNKHLIIIALTAISTLAAAQSGTNSPYSQFGLGKMADPSVGASKGMNGTGIAFREGNQVNPLNPASYSSIDSLTFVLDLGMSMQSTRFKETDGSAKTVKNADFEYAVASFRALRHLGVAFGILPYTNIGYNYKCPMQSVGDFHLAPANTSTTYYSTSYVGDGGLHEVFVGMGWQPMEGLSVGFNTGYMWGHINNYYTMAFTESSTNSLAKQFTANVRSYKIDLGLQYSRKISPKDEATIGLTYSPGHKLHSDAQCLIISGDSATAIASNPYALPTQLGIGFAWKHRLRWKLGLDYTLQKWSSIPSTPYIDQNTGQTVAKTGEHKDRHTISLGGEYCKNAASRDLVDKLRYRFGVGYSSSHLKINQANGPRQISVSAGLGIPIVNGYNDRSIINIGVSWQNLKAANMLTENTLLFNIGLTFNERWFAKWKFQ